MQMLHTNYISISVGATIQMYDQVIKKSKVEIEELLYRVVFPLKFVREFFVLIRKEIITVSNDT